MNNKKYAYVTLLTTNSYINGVIILYESLQKVKSQYPLLCLVTEDISQDIIDILNKLTIKTVLVNKLRMPDNIVKYNQTVNADRAAI